MLFGSKFYLSFSASFIHAAVNLTVQIL